MKVRDLKLSMLKDWPFLLSLFLIPFNYLTFVILFIVSLKPEATFTHLVVFHILSLMVLWSLISVVIVDPGYLPLNWEYDDWEEDRRRFCLNCNSFRPERARHCMGCGRCTMGLLFHERMLASCVGFKTRKMFFLFITYWDLLSIYVFCVELWMILEEHSEPDWSFLAALRLIVLIFNSLQAIFSSLLVGPHLILIKDNKLIFENQNTLSVYDVGKG